MAPTWTQMGAERDAKGTQEANLEAKWRQHGVEKQAQGSQKRGKDSPKGDLNATSRKSKDMQKV